MDVVIRHAYPPNWSPPASGRWVHIQPWEFGYLPLDWAPPLRDLVDEIWAPSNYVRQVYQRSGVPAEKIHVVPWGVDPQTYCVEGPALAPPGKRSFAFLFVGGTLKRKGFDILLAAYTSAFSPDDDVSLIVKDQGTALVLFLR